MMPNDEYVLIQLRLDQQRREAALERQARRRTEVRARGHTAPPRWTPRVRAALAALRRTGARRDANASAGAQLANKR